MTFDDVQRLIDRIAVLRHPCDLDLLVFFARHPSSLLTSEQLATMLGYESKGVAESLEILLEVGFLTRAQNPSHAARLYTFQIGSTIGEWLPPLLDLASTRQGRLDLLDALARRIRENPDDSDSQGQRPQLARRGPGSAP